MNPVTQSTEVGPIVVMLARSAIAKSFGDASDLPPVPDWLLEPGASFVTLKRDKELRGCVGSVESQRKLYDDIQANAYAAAFRDPRFLPLREDEFASTMVEVSLLSVCTPMKFADEQDALSQLRPRIDGVVLEFGTHRGTFLPQVWKTIPEPYQFLRQLKLKTGLAANFWHHSIRMSRYTVTKYSEAAGGEDID